MFVDTKKKKICTTYELRKGAWERVRAWIAKGEKRRKEDKIMNRALINNRCLGM